MIALILALALSQQKDLPEPVQQTVTKELGEGAKFKSQKESDGTYTVETKTVALHVSAVGNLISRKEIVPTDKLPKEVQETIKKELTRKVETQKVTKVYYEASAGDVKLKIDEDGTIAKREEKIKPSELPEAVSKAAKAKWEGGSIAKAKKITEDGRVRYEVTVESSGKKVEAVFTDEGKEIH